MPKLLEKLLIVMVRSRMPGSEAMLTCRWSSNT